MELVILILIICIVILVIAYSLNQEKEVETIKEEARAFLTKIKNNNGLKPVSTDAILKKGEVCFYSASSILSETRAVRYSSGGFGGVRVAKGIYLGASKGRSESKQELIEIAKGRLVITNKRIIFSGDFQNRTISILKVVSTENDLNEIEIAVEGRQKALVFSAKNSLILTSIVRICASVENPQDFGEDFEFGIEII